MPTDRDARLIESPEELYELKLDFASGMGTFRGNTRALSLIVRDLSSRRRQVEWRALTVIQEAGPKVPVPRILGTCNVNGRNWGLLTYEGSADFRSILPRAEFGPPLPGFLPPASRIDQLSILHIVREIAHALRNLHTVTLTEFGLLLDNWREPWVRSARHFTEHEIEYALSRCGRRGWLDTEDSVYVRGWLSERLDTLSVTEPPRLVHFDLHPGNIRIQLHEDGGWSLVALVDFEHAIGWLAEFDLASLSNFLAAMPEAHELLLVTYGLVDEIARVRFDLCLALRMLITMGARELSDPWARWCATRLATLVARPRRG